MSTSETTPTFGRSIRPPIEICARNLPRPMYPLMIQLCYFCQKSSSERDCYMTDSGKVYFSIQMCRNCYEYNSVTQEAGRIVLNRHNEERKQMAAEPEKIPNLIEA